MKKFIELTRKYGLGMIIYCATLDGYRRQLLNDRNNNILDSIKEERRKMKDEERNAYERIIEENLNKVKNKETIGNYKEASDDYQKAVEKFNGEPSEYNKNVMVKSHDKMIEAFDEIKKLDISDYFWKFYNSYNDYLDSLSPDKIVCLFNIIVYGLILSSFFSVLSIMLSENIINKLSFLEKYPRLLKILKIRNYINKKISKLYLIMHLITILAGILGNIYMFML